MTTSSTPSSDGQPRDATYWAQQVSSLKVSQIPSGALNLNVEGRRVLSPLQGFGQMWQKTYKVYLKGATVKPAEVIKAWKENFPQFWNIWHNSAIRTTMYKMAAPIRWVGRFVRR